MAFEKQFGSTAGAYGTAANWLPISARNANYSWTLSGSGSNEYYLRTAANGNPGLTSAPTSVYLNGSSVTSGTIGALTAGHWAYGNNDTLGYNTLYVRTSGSVDPDTLAADYVQFYSVPIAGDNVTFPVSAFGVIAGSDQSAVAINRFVTESKWAGVVGSASSYLRVDPDFLEWNGGGGFLNIGAAAIDVAVRGTTNAAQGYRALTLLGTAIDSLDLQGASSLELPTGAVVTTGSVQAGELYIASGASVATLNVYGGTVTHRGSGDDLVVYGGKVLLYGTLTGSVRVEDSGQVIYMTGDIPAVEQNGGIFDEQQSGLARTIAEYRYTRGQHLRNKEAVTQSDYDITRSVRISG